MEKLLQSYINYPIALKKLQNIKFSKAKLHTCNSVKSISAIKKKIRRKEKINDYLRFTIEVSDIKSYTKVCNLYKDYLEPFKVTNHWKKNNKAYNGYHIYANTYRNFPYEVQIHTTKSLFWRDNKLSHTLYESSKYALDNEQVLLYMICQGLIYYISSELILEALYINFMFQFSNTGL